MAKLNVTIPINDKQEFKKFNLAPERLTPAAPKGGQYQVQVGQTLRAEQTSMGQLSKALGTFGGPLLSGYAQLSEIDNNKAKEELATYSDEKKRELLGLGKDLNKELRRMGFNPNHSLTVQRSLGDVEVSPAMTSWNTRLDEITQSQANGEQLTQKQLQQEWGKWRADYISTNETLGKNIYAKEGFVTSTDALFARNQGVYMKNIDNHYDSKVRNPNIGSALVTAFEQSPETFIQKYTELTDDMSKTEVLEVLDWVSKNTEGFSQKNNYKEMLIDLQQSDAKAGNAKFSAISDMEIGMTRLDKTLKELKNKDELSDIQLAAKRRAKELEEIKGDFFKDYNAANGEEAKEKVIESYRQKTYNVEGFTSEDNTMLFGDVNEWLIAMENSHDADMNADNLKLDKLGQEATADFSIQLNQAVISGDMEAQKKVITDINTFVTENKDKLGGTRLKELSDLALATHNGINEIKLSTVNSVVNVMPKPLVENNSRNAFDNVRSTFNLGTTANKYLLSDTALANEALNVKAYVLDFNDLQQGYRDDLKVYSDKVTSIRRNAAEKALQDNPSLFGNNAGIEDKAAVIAEPLLEKALKDLNQSFIDRYKRQADADEKKKIALTKLSPKQLENKINSGEIKDLNEVYEAQGKNPYEFKDTENGTELSIFDGYFRNVYEGDFRGGIFSNPDKTLNKQFLGHYIEAFSGRQTSGRNIVHFITPESKASNHKAALGSLEQSNLIEEVARELVTGVTKVSGPYGTRPLADYSGSMYEGTAEPMAMYDGPPLFDTPLSLSQMLQREALLGDYLSIRGVVDEFDSGEINGFPLFGEGNLLGRYKDTIQTVPTDIIRQIDSEDLNPNDNELLKSRAEKLGVSPAALYNINKRILTRQGLTFSEDEVEINLN